MVYLSKVLVIYTHRVSVHNQDVKSGNILLTKDGRAKLGTIQTCLTLTMIIQWMLTATFDHT